MTFSESLFGLSLWNILSCKKSVPFGGGNAANRVNEKIKIHLRKTARVKFIFPVRFFGNKVFFGRPRRNQMKWQKRHSVDLDIPLVWKYLLIPLPVQIIPLIVASNQVTPPTFITYTAHITMTSTIQSPFSSSHWHWLVCEQISSIPFNDFILSPPLSLT